MKTSADRIKNSDGSYTVIIKFVGSETEVQNAMKELEERVEKEIGRKPNFETLKDDI